MRKPKSQEIKRKIDSKIFELQLALLSEDAGAVDEALLRECAAWFRPQHLQDIVIERSEAEGRCGWPGCGEKLPSWRKAAPLMFDIPEGGQFARFCQQSCMSKTTIYLSSIPQTSPYSRENLVRLAWPTHAGAAAAVTPGALQDRPTGANGSEGAGPVGGGPGKVYKLARRRDIPPPSRKISPDTAPAAAAAAPAVGAAPKAGGVRDTGIAPRPREGDENDVVEAVAAAGEDGEKAAKAAAVAVPWGSDSVSVHASDKGEKQEEEEEEDGGEKARKDGKEVEVGGAVEAGTGAGAGARPSSNAVAGGASGCFDGGGVEVSTSGGGDGHDSNANSVDMVQASFEKVSISEREDGADSGAATSSAAAVPAEPAKASGATQHEGAASVPALIAATAAGAAPVAAAAAAVGGTAWENMRLSRTRASGAVSLSSDSLSSVSVVSRHASLAAAAAEISAVIDSSSAAAADAPAAGVRGERPSPTAAASTAPRSPKAHVRRRKSVSFADGTKDIPEAVASSLPPQPSRRGNAAAAKEAGAAAEASAGAVAATDGGGAPETRRRRGGRDGRGSGRTAAGRGRGKQTPSPKKNVLGGVVERTPAAPAPMEARVGGGDGARASAGAVEGHLPRIEADLSFRVVPRGRFHGAATGGGGGSEEILKGLGNYGLGVDGGPLTKDEIEEERDDDGSEDEDYGSGGELDADAEENDRAIWRESFGEEMPAGVAGGTWIDMKAVRDKDMREEFASWIAPFALLWSTLSEWVTPATRAVCLAGRSAAIDFESALMGGGGGGAGGVCSAGGDKEVGAAAQPPAMAATPHAEATEEGEGHDGTSGSISNGGHRNRRRFFPADFQARKAGAVAKAIEAVASRHTRNNWGRGKTEKRDGEAGNPGDHCRGSDRGGRDGGSEGLTFTGALRHSAVSAMVNMHLVQAERALRIAAEVIADSSAGGCDHGNGAGESGRRGIPNAGIRCDNARTRKKWTWSDTAATARQGSRVPGGWVVEEEEEGAAAVAAVAASAVPLKVPPALVAAKVLEKNGTPDGITPGRRRREGAAADVDARPERPEIKRGRKKASEHPEAERAAENFTAPGLATRTAAAESVSVGGAESRRAVAMVIDTLDAGSASAAANLSIAQWKIVSLVLLTAVGLGAREAGAGVGVVAGAEAGRVGSAETAGAEQACLRLFGPETVVTAREFRILVEVLLEG